MDVSEFDKFAHSYRDMHTKSIAASGENPEYFAEYKIKDVAREVQAAKLPADLKILDFGCGIGGSVPYFRQHLPGAELTGIDVSQKSLDIAEERFPGAATYLAFDGKILPFADRTFDVVFTACVFHHIPEEQHEPLLAEIRRVLKPNGQFFIFEHNPRNPLTLSAVNNCPFDENAVLIDASLMLKRIRAAGFGQMRPVYRIFFPRMLSGLRFLEPLLTWVPFGAQYYIRAVK
jgi:ubiquinone/menaquinone biosynthesis C-methylase UbiE